MTTAHRPTFQAAQGKDVQRGPALHTRLLPAYTTLKFRQAGQGGDADKEPRDLRAELLRAEAIAKAKKSGKLVEENSVSHATATKRTIEAANDDDDDDDNDADDVDEDPEAKRRRLILEQAAEEDADSAGSSEGDSSDEDDDDEEDETAELMRELEKIKRERAEQKAKDVCANLISRYVQVTNAYKRKQPKQRRSKSSANMTLLVEILY